MSCVEGTRMLITGSTSTVPELSLLHRRKRNVTGRSIKCSGAGTNAAVQGRHTAGVFGRSKKSLMVVKDEAGKVGMENTVDMEMIDGALLVVEDIMEEEMVGGVVSRSGGEKRDREVKNTPSVGIEPTTTWLKAMRSTS
uniref:Uncharacterized protein n=1 Tax=Salix viminalis TaxID=40686 RepID=A0A6N2LC00_SALVM